MSSFAECDAIHKGEAPEEILHWLSLLRNRAELLGAIEELRYLLRASHKGAERSNGTPGRLPSAHYYCANTVSAESNLACSILQLPMSKSVLCHSRL